MKPILQVVIGIIQNGDQVLIARKVDERPADSGIVNNENTKDFLLGLWHFPGGKVETGEDLESAMIREAKQETNLDISIQNHLGERIEERDKVILRINWFSCKYKSGIAKAGDDIVEVKWISKNQAQKYCAQKIIEQWPDAILELLNSQK